MTVRPDFGSEYGDEERKRWEEEAPPGPTEAEEEREYQESKREDEEVNFIDAESNEAHAPGSVCNDAGRSSAPRRTLAGAGRPVGPRGVPRTPADLSARTGLGGPAG